MIYLLIHRGYFNMELRFIRRGEAYIPQYKTHIDTDFKYVNKKLLGTKMIKNVADVLSNLSWPGRWNNGSVFVDVSENMLIETGNKNPEFALIFKTEIHTMAFLGAFKSFYSTDIKSFE